MPLNQELFLRRAHRFLIYFGGFYVVVLVLITIPPIQRHLIFLHKARWPLNADFTRPEKYGLAPHKTLSVNITTSDNVHLGAWFILADPFYSSSYRVGSSSSDSPTLSLASVYSALRLYPTVIFFHGNAGTRAVSFRIATYASYTTRLATNVLALDYRGYADSEGTPSEEGLQRDARAAWDWVISQGADPEDVVLVGQSLGTGVVAQLAQELTTEGVKPRGLVFISPYSSMATLLETYNILGWIPLLRPLQTFPFAQNLILKFLNTKFDTKTALPNIKSNIVLIHAEDDYDIPLSHSIDLFNALLAPSLPDRTLTPEQLKKPTSLSLEQWEEWKAVELLRQRVRDDIVRVDEVEGLGKISRFTRKASRGEVVFVESIWGGHNYVGKMEGVIDVVGQALDLTRP